MLQCLEFAQEEKWVEGKNCKTADGLTVLLSAFPCVLEPNLLHFRPHTCPISDLQPHPSPTYWSDVTVFPFSHSFASFSLQNRSSFLPTYSFPISLMALPFFPQVSFKSPTPRGKKTHRTILFISQGCCEVGLTPVPVYSKMWANWLSYHPLHNSERAIFPDCPLPSQQTVFSLRPSSSPFS